jgi:hypothetical protein
MILVPSIVDAVEHLAVAASHVHRLENEKRRREAHHSFRRLWGLVEIDDQRVQRIARIDLDVHRSIQPLVRADVAEAFPVGHHALLFHDEPDDAGLARRRHHRGQDQRD